MKKIESDCQKEQNLEVKALKEVNTKPKVTVDCEAYAHFLETSDMSEEQKRQFIQALWSVIYGFASLGFGVHRVQELEDRPCGQVEKHSRNSTREDRNTVKFNNLNNQKGSPKRIVTDRIGVENANT